MKQLDLWVDRRLAVEEGDVDHVGIGWKRAHIFSSAHEIKVPLLHGVGFLPPVTFWVAEADL